MLHTAGNESTAKMKNTDFGNLVGNLRSHLCLRIGIWTVLLIFLSMADAKHAYVFSNVQNP